MKKVILVMLSMMFALGFAYAQSNEEVDVQSDTLATITPQVQADVDSETPETPGVEPATKSDLAQLSALLSNLGQKMLEDDENDPKESFFMIGKTKVIQTVEISTIAGKDRDMDAEESDEALDKYDHGRDGGGKDREVPDVISNLNFGMNIGYSMIFIPGRVDDGLWLPNSFGFGYSTGFVASFDREDQNDVTCDFLWKLGAETGNGHALGIGIDLLLGGGKTAGTLFDMSENELTAAPYTAWCFKQGAQVWLKTNLLTTSLANTDILAFARFVHSTNPYNDSELLDAGLLNLWKEESWTFGITLRYRF